MNPSFKGDLSAWTTVVVTDIRGITRGRRVGLGKIYHIDIMEAQLLADKVRMANATPSSDGVTAKFTVNL